MNPNGTLLPLLERIRTRALIVGVIGSAVAAVGFLIETGSAAKGWSGPHYSTFDRAYLFSFVFFFGLSMGSMALLMVHRQLGGAWGFLIRRPLESAAMTLPLMAVLFIPVLVDLQRIYPWVTHDIGHEEKEKLEPTVKSNAMPIAPGNAVVVSGEGKSPGFSGTRRDPIEARTTDLFAFKKVWLTPKFFTVRVAIYFLIWIVMAVILNLGSRRQDETGSLNIGYGLQAFSAPGLVLYFVTTSLALVDWGMSLEVNWYSSLYGVLVMIGQGVSTIAFMILVSAVISRRGETEGFDKPETFNDLGNLLLAFVMLWGYLSFSQFLIIWSGNLMEEIPWYIRRLHNGWVNVGRFLMLFHFFIPFTILLARPLKRNISALWKIAAVVLFAHLLDAFWLIAPSFGDQPVLFRVTWLDVVIPIAMGGLWLATFLWYLKAKPLMVAHDPELLPALKQAGGH